MLPSIKLVARRACVVFALFAFGINAALAITPFVITDIRVEGLERLDAGTVYNYLPLKVGDELNDEEARLSIKELFGTGFFKNVELEQDGTVLVVKVTERPSISSLEIVGNKVLETEAIEGALAQAGLLEGRIFNSARLEQIEQELKDTYLSLGRYSATVDTESEELERNRVAITLNINEGRVATIKKINIIGADAISERELRKQMSLRDSRRLFSTRNQYSKQKLEADIEVIRSYYLDRGFHDFKIVDRSVEISPNKQSIFVSISIEEGAPFTFGETMYEVVRDARVAGLEDLVDLPKGEAFSRKEVNAGRNAIIELYADAGYAFVEVRPVYETDRENNVVNTVYAIDPKQRVYVRKVEINGNTHTRDQVIRRELRQFEGAWYSAEAVTLSKARLQRLGYFESVEIEIPEVPGTSDQVDMRVLVRERNTGSLSFSLGYSDTDGALFGGSFSQRNLFGTGREMTISLDTSDVSRSVSFNYINPYHTPDGISRGISLSQRRVDTDEVGSAEYVVDTTSLGLNYKIPIAETNSLNLGFTAERLNLIGTTGTPLEFQRVIDPMLVNDRRRGENVLVNLGVSRDTRDDFFFPTGGGAGSLSVLSTVPGSEFEYFKVNVQGSYYIPMPARFTFKAGMGLSFGDGYGDSSDDGLPFFSRYHAGGSNSVRGYDGRSLGPLSSGRSGNCRLATDMDTEAQSNPNMDAEDTPLAVCSAHNATSRSTVGGDTRLLVNAELLLPPFSGDIGKDKRLGLFLDGGQVFGEGFRRDPDMPTRFIRIKDTGIDLDEMRYSAGITFNWFSPIGPFSMSYTEPLNDESNDDIEKFQITVGSVFR